MLPSSPAVAPRFSPTQVTLSVIPTRAKHFAWRATLSADFQLWSIVGKSITILSTLALSVATARGQLDYALTELGYVRREGDDPEVHRMDHVVPIELEGLV